MSMFRKLILAAGVAAVPLAFAAGAKAANPDGQGVVLYNAAGVPVAILTPIQHETRVAAVAAAGEDPASRMIRRIEAATVPDDAFFPFTQIMAEQDRMMHAVMAQMRGMMAGAGPFDGDGTTEAALPAGPGAREIVISSFSSGHGSCSQTITYNYAGDAARPEVSVRKVGDSCGSVEEPNTRTVPAAAERQVPETVAPAAPTEQPAARTYRIKYLSPARQVAPSDLRG